MRIVFLKLADEKGVTQKAIAALRKKYPEYRSSGLSSWFTRSSWSEWMTNDNKITEVNLIPLYQEWLSPRLSLEFLDRMIDVAQACTAADKVMLGIHGVPGDTTCGHIDLFGVKKTITYQQLAQFILLFLPNRADDYKLVLIMCYGARSTNPHINHEGHVSATQVKSSFAYKFFKELCLQRNIVLTARTGAVSFSEHDGRALVQTEAAVGAELEIAALQPDVDRVEGAYNTLQERIFGRGGRVAMTEFRNREQRIREEMARGRTDWSMASFDDLVVIAMFRLQDRLRVLRQAAAGESSKYGKFVYRYDRPHATVSVTRKYPHPAVLYTGAL